MEFEKEFGKKDGLVKEMLQRNNILLWGGKGFYQFVIKVCTNRGIVINIVIIL
jgi:hypothetical protein